MDGNVPQPAAAGDVPHPMSGPVPPSRAYVAALPKWLRPHPRPHGRPRVTTVALILFWIAVLLLYLQVKP
ncbi:hypothetical protein [Nocardia stercoris]|uniref:Uncharacterized protein n=1 Tax=Nocardia stercoris TaxID=2483361 RepID=A0A3M2LEP2_9NOCA|nr:hypothetical protein [Nocardia stercoris]RMI35240.1 hypothetical protein EBN03_02825 [Nocardia stercoris]